LAELLNFFLMATYGGELSRRRLAALGLSAIGVAGALLAVLALVAPPPARAEASDLSRAASWLESAQNGDGGFGASPGTASSAEATCWAMLGLEAAGRNPLDVAPRGRTPVDFLRLNLAGPRSPDDLARAVLALEGSGIDPRGFGGRNLVAELLSRRRQDGSYEGRSRSTAYAILALRAAGAGGVEGSLGWLRQAQNEDGGWGDAPGSASNAEGTGAALQVLSSGSKASDRGLSYLRRTQHKGGGFARGGDGEVNTRSTAGAVEGILAAGGDPASFRRGGASAPEYLAHNQEADGSYRYAKPSAEVPDELAHQTPVTVTAEVTVAASGQQLPIPVPPRIPRPANDSSSGGSKQPPAPFGGITPDDVPVPESSTSPPGADSGGSGSPSERFAPPAQVRPAAPAGPSPSGGRVRKGSGGTASEPLASGAPAASTDDSSDASELGAIVVGLLAGALLFGAAWAGRRGWMRWRYGL
jgi:prenyltransferase beta subunit